MDMVTEKKQSAVTSFDVEQSAELLRNKFDSWKSVTLEIVEEINKARDYYSNQGARIDTSCHDGTKLYSFEKYLDYVGIKKRTAYRWLERYEPEEGRLIEPEELEERKHIESRKKQSESIAIQKRVREAINTGKKPADWDYKTEKEYNRRLKEMADSKRRVEEYKQEMEEKKKRREQEQKEKEERAYAEKQENDFLAKAAEAAIENHKKRSMFKNQIKLSQSGESDLFIDALMDYLQELDDDNRRIEACQNIIKVCKNVAVELQRA